MSEGLNADPLDALIVSADTIDRERIATALRDRLAIDRDSQDPVVLSGFALLDGKAKMLALLLLRKARSLLGLPGEEPVSPSDAARWTGVPPGTVRRLLPELVASHMASQAGGGGYLLSNAQVSAAVEFLTERSDVPARRRSSVKNSNRSKSADSDSTSKGSGEGNKPKRRTRTNSSSPSPTSLVSDLVDSGFFLQPRTLSDVQTQIKDKVGHQVPVTSLSPVFTRMLRAGTLDRERGEGGTYEYISTKSAK